MFYCYILFHKNRKEENTIVELVPLTTEWLKYDPYLKTMYKRIHIQSKMFIFVNTFQKKKELGF